MEKTYLTKEGHTKLLAELEYLKTTRRREVAQQLGYARSYGDLRENSEYEAAKHALSLNEIRIRELEEKISAAEIINTSAIPTDKVFLGNKVTVLDLGSNEEEAYELTGSDEADPYSGKISVNSPVAKALLGHIVNDVVEIKVPRGILQYKVLNITR